MCVCVGGGGAKYTCTRKRLCICVRVGAVYMYVTRCRLFMG